MIKINVFVINKKWKKYIKNPDYYLKIKIFVLKKKNKFFTNKKLEFSIRLAGGQEIKKLNNSFRKKNKITDVLSFPFNERKFLTKLFKSKNNIYLGDIIINFDKVLLDSRNFGFKKYFDKIWIHGLVHLLGGTHKFKKDFIKMKKIEKKFFSSIN